MSKLLEHLKDKNVFFVQRINRKVTLVMINPLNKTAIIEDLKCDTLEKAETIEDFFEARLWKSKEAEKKHE